MNNYNKFQSKTKNAINHHILGSILFMNFSTLNVKLLSEFKLTLIVVPSGNPSLIIIRANGVSMALYKTF